MHIKLILVCSFILSIHGGEKGPTDQLIKCLIQIESSGNVRAIGDKHLKHWAYGPLQVRQLVCDDINKRYGTNYKAEQCLGNLPLSITIFKKYVMMWGTQKRLGREPTDEDFARIWNGGPNGWKWNATDKYIAKVNRLTSSSNKVLIARK